MSLPIDIADAVVASLNGGSFSQSFTAERRYVPKQELAELSGLHVTVVPKARELQAGGRNLTQHDMRIDVAVQKKVAPNENTEPDTLMSLIQEILEHLSAEPLPGLAAVRFVKAANEPIFSVEHLDQYHVFTSLLTVTYRAMTGVAP